MDSSNNPETVESTGIEAASPIEQTETTIESAPPEADLAPSESTKEVSLKDKIQALRKEKGELKAEKAEDTPEAEVVPEASPEAPKYEANLKYKAFGKEKELDQFWAPLIKDAESEKKVKDVFTRADAFDDMKSRYETASFENQKTLQQFTALDRDVKRVTKFLNTGDYDNFFSSLRISDDMLLQHLQNKAEIARMSPVQQQAYQQGVHSRAEQLIQQENYEQLQSNFTNQMVQHRTMQLDLTLARPDVSNAVSAWDSKMGLGAFRNLVIQEAAAHYHASKQDLPAEGAVELVMKKFGKLLEQPAQPQVVGSTQAMPGTQATPQAPVVVQGKPVIPNVQGRGTSPIKQAPKSLDDLKKMAKAARMAESQGYVADTGY